MTINESLLRSIAQSAMTIEKQMKIQNKIELLNILRERGEITQEEYIDKIVYLYNSLK